MGWIKVSMAIHRDDVGAVAAPLASIDGLHLVEPPEQQETGWHDLAERLADHEQRLQHVMQVLQIELPEMQRPRQLDPLKDAQQAEDVLEQVEGELQESRQREEDLQQQHARLRRMAGALRQLQAMGVSTEEVRDLRYLDVRLGWIPSDQRGRMDMPLRRTPLVLMFLLEEERQVLVAAATDRDHGFVLERVLRAMFYQPLDLSQVADIGKEAVQKPEQTLDYLQRQQQKVRKERRQIAGQWQHQLIGTLRRVSAALRSVRLIDRYAAPHGERVFFSGYVWEDDADSLAEAVESVATRPHAVFMSKAMEEVS